MSRPIIAGELRQMRRSDLPEVLAIENHTHQFPWSEAIFRDCLKSGYHCCVLVMPNTEVIQGYGVLSAAVGEAHLCNLCVRPEWQGQGLARRILQHLLDFARTEAVQTVFLEVRVSNVAAVCLYKAAGFCVIGLRVNYYPARKGQREDALVMAKELA